ncbi:MAG: hypothetical protein ACR2NW_02830 [Thermodesulfobacteriota bacterium]
MNIKKLSAFITVLLIFFAVGVFLIFKPHKTRSIEKKYTIISPLYNVDKVYKSMKGPYSTSKFRIPGVRSDEIIWITGFKAVMVGKNPSVKMSQEFMCHSNLDINIKKHREIFGLGKNSGSRRLFTLSQGQYEIKFPDGYGIPVLGNEVFNLTTQVLNLNNTEKKHDVRHKVTISYIFDKDSDKKIKPLMQMAAVGLKLLDGEDGYYNINNPSEEHHGSSCLIGQNASTHTYKDDFNREFTGHWVVEPGREVNRTNTTRFLSLPYDTTIHYIAVHLHPFAEFLKLVDLTTGETLFKSKVKSARDKIGIEHVEFFESEKGIPIYKDHQYQLISNYNNTSHEPQDSMAVMYLYVNDKEFNPEFITYNKQN